MPKKNNQNKPNGFMMYAEEIKTSLLMEGHSIRSKPDLITAASPKWQVKKNKSLFQNSDYLCNLAITIHAKLRK